MSDFIIPAFVGQINVKRPGATPLFSERYGMVPTVVVFGWRFTWRKWNRA